MTYIESKRKFYLEDTHLLASSKRSKCQWVSDRVARRFREVWNGVINKVVSGGMTTSLAIRWFIDTTITFLIAWKSLSLLRYCC